MSQITGLPKQKISISHEYQGDGIYLAQFKTQQNSIFSYYFQSKCQAYIIDPIYDPHPYQQLAFTRKSQLLSILLTHFHDDHTLKYQQFKLPIIMGPKSSRLQSKIRVYEFQNCSDFNLGQIWINVLHTPGHTLQSTCYLIKDANKKQICVFTGDTLYAGDVGRPDLRMTALMSMEELGKMLYQSIRKIKYQVKREVRVYPMHGFGVAYGRNIQDCSFCTLDSQYLKNQNFKIEEQDKFLQNILNDIPSSPQNSSKSISTQSQKSIAPLAKSLSIQQFNKQISKGCAIIETRHDYQSKSIKNSLLLSQTGVLYSWINTFVTAQTPLLLICGKDKQTVIIQKLANIGYTNVRGFNNFTIDQWKSKGLPIWQPKSVNAKTATEVKQKISLDVRSFDQWQKTGILQNAKLLDLDELKLKWEQLKGLKNIYVNCQVGMRARLACSFLAQKDIPSTIVFDKFQEFSNAGAKIIPYQHPQ